MRLLNAEDLMRSPGRPWPSVIFFPPPPLAMDAPQNLQNLLR